MGDFSAQAVVNTILSRAFPEDPIVGEEDSKDLRGDSPGAATLRNRVVDLAVEALARELGLGEVEEWGLGPEHTHTPEELLDAIDRGTHSGGAVGRKLFTFVPSLAVLVDWVWLRYLRDVDP